MRWRGLDQQLKKSHRRILTGIAASGTTLTELLSVGPIIACYLIGYTGDIGRLRAVHVRHRGHAHRT